VLVKKIIFQVTMSLLFIQILGVILMIIQNVQTRRDFRKFIQFPYHFYRDDPNWIAPLRSEQWAQFDPQKNPILDHCDTQLFLLKEGKAVIGRCSAFIDHLAVEHWGESIGLFGSFECVGRMRRRLRCC
jgi:hypothetical protein